MTDIIDELFTQAGGYIEIDKDGNRWTYSQECDPDTFAELIIKECIEVINYNVEVALDATGNVVFEDKLLKKHFGIE